MPKFWILCSFTFPDQYPHFDIYDKPQSGEFNNYWAYWLSLTHIKLGTKTLKFPTHWLSNISLNRCAWTTIASSELYLLHCRMVHIVDSFLQTGIDSQGLKICTTLDGWNDSTRPLVVLSIKFKKFVEDTLPKLWKLASVLVFGFLPIIAAVHLRMCSNELEPYCYLFFSSTFHESSIISY